MRKRLVVQVSSVSRSSEKVLTLRGPASVIDGDTIVVAGERIRLHGIDAPELGQTFWYRGQNILCGTMALAALQALTAGVEVLCQIVEYDIYGRLIGKCYASNGVDIGERMVLSGWALAYRQFSLDYAEAEEAARQAERGLWGGSFMMPWRWRQTIPPKGADLG
jgi:endonuclease YncB( thermonuclease family)